MNRPALMMLSTCLSRWLALLLSLLESATGRAVSAFARYRLTAFLLGAGTSWLWSTVMLLAWQMPPPSLARSGSSKSCYERSYNLHVLGVTSMGLSDIIHCIPPSLFIALLSPLRFHSGCENEVATRCQTRGNVNPYDGGFSGLYLTLSRLVQEYSSLSGKMIDTFTLVKPANWNATLSNAARAANNALFTSNFSDSNVLDANGEPHR